MALIFNPLVFFNYRLRTTNTEQSSAMVRKLLEESCNFTVRFFCLSLNRSIYYPKYLYAISIHIPIRVQFPFLPKILPFLENTPFCLYCILISLKSPFRLILHSHECSIKISTYFSYLMIMMTLVIRVYTFLFEVLSIFYFFQKRKSKVQIKNRYFVLSSDCIIIIFFMC